MIQLKKSTARLLPIAVLLAMANTGCTLSRMVKKAKSQEITVNPSPLAASGTEVIFELKATLPKNMLQDNYRYKLDVLYEAEGQKQEPVGSLNFDAGEYLYDKGKPTITKQFSFPYTPQKDKGRLLVQGTAIDKRKKGRVKLTPEQQVAVGLLTTPLLIVRHNEFTYIPDNYKEIAGGPTQLPFYFDENQHTTKSYLGSNLDVLDQYIMDNVKQQTITITGSQAPNEKGTELAQNRARALADYYRDKLKTLDYSGKKVDIKTTTEPPTWDMLLEKINRSALPKAQKQEVKTILEGKATDREKQQALQQAQAYDYIQLYIYPAMRYARVEIDYKHDRKSDYELYLLARRIADETVDADVLTEEELQYAATLTPLLAERRKLYEAAVKTTDKWPAYFNLGTVYTEMARKDYRPKAKQALLARAINNLNFAGFRNPTAEVNYALASAYHLRGDKLEALQYYNYAIKLGGSEEMLHRVFADKAALEIEIGQYDDAIESLTYAGDSYQTNMNLGLSYMLKENYEGAQQYYEKAMTQKPDDALAHYSLSIIGARTQNEQQLTQHLRRAVQRDSTLMQKAIDDLEFSAYRDKAAYKDALLR